MHQCYKVCIGAMRVTRGHGWMWLTWQLSGIWPLPPAARCVDLSCSVAHADSLSRSAGSRTPAATTTNNYDYHQCKQI